MFLAIHPWSDRGLLLDERRFSQVDPKDSRRRLVGRQISTRVAKGTEEANWRADENDMLSDHEHFRFLPSLIPVIYSGGQFIIARLPELFKVTTYQYYLMLTRSTSLR